MLKKKKTKMPEPTKKTDQTPVSPPATPKKGFTKYQFSMPQLAVFTLVFALLGGIFIYRSFAAEPLVAAVQGESMLNETGGTASTSTYVSDLPYKQVANGYGPVEKDRSNGEKPAGDGKVLTLNGKTYTKGLGAHAYSEITVALDGQYDTFTSDIGIDDEIDSHGCSSSAGAIFKVYVEGTKVYDSGLMQKSTATKAVKVTVTGKTQLKLVLADGNSTLRCDHGDWAGATLVRNDSTSSSVGTVSQSQANVISDSLASGGKAARILSAITISGKFSLPANASSIAVIARGESCNGVGPNMVVKVDGTQIMSQDVTSINWTTYTANTSLLTGNHTLSISFTNDYYSPGVCDRNLYFDVANFYGNTTPPPPPASTTTQLSASPTSVAPGASSTLTWSSTNADSCSASGGWSGAKTASGTASTGGLSSTTTYTLTCTGPGGSTSANATVTVATAPTPPPPVSQSGTLPYTEAQLRTGFVKVTIADPRATTYTTPVGVDVLIDGQWIRREQALKIYVQPGQRVHIKNMWIDSNNLPGNSRGLSTYWRGGLGVRMAAGTTAGAGAEHVSVTGYLASGAGLTDGFTIGGTSDVRIIQKVTVQNFRIENASMSNGGVASSETAEHMDCFQAQGPFSRVEFGQGVMYRQWAPAGSHPGKGLMLNAYSANSQTYTVAMNRVLFRDQSGSVNSGAVWIKDFNTTRIELTDVWSKIDGTPTSAWQWINNSGLFLSTATQNGANQGWTSSGTAPSRVASFPTVSNVSGVVKEGLPPGGDYVTRASLGL